MHSLEEKKELVIANYRQSYDIDVAMMQVDDLNEDEKKLLLRDESFMYRIKYTDAQIREEIVQVMTGNLRSEDDKLRQKAAIDLGNLIWAEKFKGKPDDTKGNHMPDTIILKGKKVK